ncbi:MAG: isoprenyl transferase [Bryobacteraceae bacterium]|nr:isoprenyl transferase [Bryobacteraceae bacterium]
MQQLFRVLDPGTEDWVLARQIDPSRLPAHVAIIMDGNGRWAKRRLLPRVAGHKAGIDSVRSVMETAARLNLEALTLYAFSTENWKRPKSEIDTLFRLLRFFLRQELATMMEHNIQLNAIGRIEDLPEAARDELHRVIGATSGNTGLKVNLALNYSGRSDIVDGVNRLIEEARAQGQLGALEISESVLDGALSTAGLPDPDLLIRTSGEMRISNFLLWQIAYAEIYVTNTYWPDFRCGDLLRAILDYQKRDRRFGGLSALERVQTEDRALEAEAIPAR